MYNNAEFYKFKKSPSNVVNEDIDKLIRGEISAVEAYEQVMDKVRGGPEFQRLKNFKMDHERAVNFWNNQARVLGKLPETDSSVWGAVVGGFVGLSKITGETSAIRALKKGEEYGLDEYQTMLDSEKLTNHQKKEISETYIPRQENHIEMLQAMIRA